jgi:methyl-accepting chemotaxis protein
MGTQIAVALGKGQASDVGRALAGQISAQLGGRTPALVTLFPSPDYPLAEVMAAFRAALPATPTGVAAPVVLGATTAGEFTQTGDATGSVSAFAVAGDFRVFGGVGRPLRKNVEQAVTQALADIPQEQEGYPYRTAVLFIDGLVGVGEEATLTAAALLGPGVRLCGGCAADDWRLQATAVGCDGTVSGDALAIAILFSKQPLGIGVFHGHQPLSEAMTITRASENVVHEIDGRPAWDVFVEKTRTRALQDGIDPDKLTTDSDILQYFLKYETGIKTGPEFRIRMPLIRNEDKSLGFVCGMPEGTPIHFMASDPQKQIESARAAAQRARAQLAGQAIAGALVVDCGCRKLILKDRFSEAVQAIAAELGDVPIAGFESYGEIALNDDDFSGFHNTTTVLLAFPAEDGSAADKPA